MIIIIIHFKFILILTLYMYTSWLLKNIHPELSAYPFSKGVRMMMIQMQPSVNSLFFVNKSHFHHIKVVMTLGKVMLSDLESTGCPKKVFPCLRL